MYVQIPSNQHSKVQPFYPNCFCTVPDLFSTSCVHVLFCDSVDLHPSVKIKKTQKMTGQYHCDVYTVRTSVRPSVHPMVFAALVPVDPTSGQQVSCFSRCCPDELNGDRQIPTCLPPLLTAPVNRSQVSAKL